MRQEPLKLWLDCDPGHDDAMAIILAGEKQSSVAAHDHCILSCLETPAGHNQLVNLIGVSTIAGNQTTAKVTQNALDILYAAGLSCIGR
jgi:inosine-uridine nucleoside N-ribohydrolase